MKFAFLVEKSESSSPFIMRMKQLFHYKWGFPMSSIPSIFAASH